MSSNAGGGNAVTALILGICGIAFLLIGCMCGPFAMLAPVCSLLAVIFASMEMSRINQGLSSEGNRATATMGGALGGAGCLLQLLYWCAIGGLMVAYFVVVVVAVIAGA